jgi:hypothetical protein
MKKALVVFLLLALVGGSLFAQEGLTFAGAIDAGVGMYKMQDVDDIAVGMVAPWVAVDGLFARFYADYTAPGGNAGFRMQIRSLGSPTGFPNSVDFRRAIAWVSGLDGMIKFVGGKIDTAEIASVGGYNGVSLFSTDYGVITYLYPLDILRIGVGLKTPFALTDGKTMDDPFFWGGLRLAMPDLFLAAATFRTRKEQTDATVSLATNGLPIYVGAALELYRLDDFSDSGRMEVYADASFDVAGLSLDLNVRFVNASAQDDPYYSGVLTGAYPIGNIVPKLNIGYGQGGEYAMDAGFNAIESVLYGRPSVHNPDQSFISIAPEVQLRVASNRYVTLGAVVNKDLGDVNAIGGEAKQGMNFGAFASVRVSF